MKTKEEWLEIMHRQDKKFGAIKGTLDEENQEKRIERLDLFTDVTEAVVDYCESHDIKYVLCQNIFTKRQHTHHITDIYLPDQQITLIHQDMDNPMHIKAGDYFYKINHYFYHPFFIRTTETKDYVLMKLKNTIELSKVAKRTGIKSIKFVGPQKRKRTVIKAVRVGRKII